jgi:hypothetical protein
LRLDCERGIYFVYLVSLPLFVATGATKWNDPAHLPWTIGWQPSYQTEASIYACGV